MFLEKISYGCRANLEFHVFCSNDASPLSYKPFKTIIYSFLLFQTFFVFVI